MFRRTCRSCSLSSIWLLVPMLMETTILVQHSLWKKYWILEWLVARTRILVSEEHIRSVSSCSITISTMCSQKGLWLQQILVFYGTKKVFVATKPPRTLYWSWDKLWCTFDFTNLLVPSSLHTSIQYTWLHKSVGPSSVVWTGTPFSTKTVLEV
jgi:hypothetical protein